MKTILILLLFYFPCAESYAQIQVAVWTDKSSYVYGDTIAITITAFNPTPDTLVLIFGTTCQVGYTIDNVGFIDGLPCANHGTFRVIPPFGTTQWNSLRYPAHYSVSPLLSPGSHSVTGKVLWHNPIDYATSDSITIFVTPATSVSTSHADINTFALNQNFPNPFNGMTTIGFTLPTAGNVTIRLYNSLGQEVRTLLNDFRSAGSYSIRAKLDDLPSGAYWCRLQESTFSQTMKLLLTK